MNYKAPIDAVSQETGEMPATARRIVEAAFSQIRAGTVAGEHVGVARHGVFSSRAVRDTGTSRVIFKVPKPE